MKEVKITRQRLEELEDAELKLRYLENGGVDNWEWYSESLTEYFKLKEQKEKIQESVDELLEIISDGIEEPAGRGCGYGIREDKQDEVRDFLIKLLNIGA